jgi:hypothetical protein
LTQLLRKSYRRKLAIGAPLDFSANEKHSFQEWLKLSEHNLSIEETKKHNTKTRVKEKKH